MTTSHTLRAATAGAMLAQQLHLCIAAEASSQPYPPVEAIDFDTPEDVARAFELTASILGIQSPDDEERARLVLLFQALAEIIAVQGADLEANFYNLIHQRGHKTAWRQYVGREGTA